MTVNDAGQITSIPLARAAPGSAIPARAGAQSAVELPTFRALIAAKRRTIIPLVAIYVLYFFGVMLLAGYARGWMAEPLVGALNNGYVLIIGTYLMCWVIAAIYLVVATRRFDPQAAEAVAEAEQKGLRS